MARRLIPNFDMGGDSGGGGGGGDGEDPYEELRKEITLMLMMIFNMHNAWLHKPVLKGIQEQLKEHLDYMPLLEMELDTNFDQYMLLLKEAIKFCKWADKQKDHNAVMAAHLDFIEEYLSETLIQFDVLTSN